MNLVKRLLKESEGATAVEYAVLLALILIAIIAAINSVGGTNDNLWSNNEEQITNAMNGSS